MSVALYNSGAIRFWSEREIMLREQFARRIVHNVMDNLRAINGAWQSFQCDGPLLTPCSHISSAYDGDDVFLLQAKIAEQEMVMRPETTPSSYAYARMLLESAKAKPPAVVWQMGKSFRRETNDGASPAKLRFNEFYQLELQCIYRADSKADYRKAVVPSLMKELQSCSGLQARTIPSDRLPSYSNCTDDIELIWNDDFKEVCSISTRTDFAPFNNNPMHVLEVAVGMDRLVCMAQKHL